MAKRFLCGAGVLGQGWKGNALYMQKVSSALRPAN